MKNIIFLAAVSMIAFESAFAGYKYTETETVIEKVDVTIGGESYQPCRFRSSRDVGRKCTHSAGQPVKVKTHTEVIDHYQVYQPVTVYKPMGTEIQRRIVPVKTCNKCGF